MSSTQRFETVIVGGGQAGLAMGYHLARTGRPFVILDAGQRVGDSWRGRWDSLRLFTPALIDALPGSRFPAPPWSFPAKDEFADYLGAYAAEFALPVRSGMAVRSLTREDGRYVVQAGEHRFEADNVVVATGYDQLPKLPAFSSDLVPGILQLHAGDYHDPAQLPEGDVLVVGAGNSGADIALELATHHRVFLSGRHPGQVPWRVERALSRPLDRAVFFAFAHLLTVRTPIGRRLRPQALAHSGPLIRVKSGDLDAAGVRRVPRVTGARDGLPLLADGRILPVRSLVWSTGFRPDTSWIELPGFDADGDQIRGVAEGQPGLYFLGRLFQYCLASSMIQGVGRDAAYLASQIAARMTGNGAARGERQGSTV